MNKWKFKIGDTLNLGLIPCKKCGERHVETVTHIRPLMTSWIMNGHAYEEIEQRKYIQMQRDEYNEALKTIRRLKSKIRKLEKNP